MKVRDVMVRKVVTIEPSASLAEAAQRMREANVGVLPVVDEGEVRGVITDRDLVVRVSDPLLVRVALEPEHAEVVHLDLGGQPVVTLSDPEARLGAGDIVSLRLNKPLFFDAAGGRVAA